MQQDVTRIVGTLELGLDRDGSRPVEELGEAVKVIGEHADIQAVSPSCGGALSPGERHGSQSSGTPLLRCLGRSQGGRDVEPDLRVDHIPPLITSFGDFLQHLNKIQIPPLASQPFTACWPASLPSPQCLHCPALFLLLSWSHFLLPGRLGIAFLFSGMPLPGSFQSWIGHFLMSLFGHLFREALPDPVTLPLFMSLVEPALLVYCPFSPI